jgi:GPH family glycoside/pentoside/hexuronide:cation symporter
MFFAYAGSFIALGAWEPLCDWFQTISFDTARSWQLSMVCIAFLCLLGFLLCFSLTREHVKTTVNTASVGKDIRSLLCNSPWWILNGVALCSNFFNTIRGATAAYYFKDYVGADASISFGIFSIVLYAGLFLMIGEICNMIGVALAVPTSTKWGKKTTYILSLSGLVLFSILFFFLPNDVIGWWMKIFLQITISITTGILSPLVWSMYADVADYAEWKYRSSSTGLVFSSGSMAQKFGGAFAGWVVMALLEFFGYDTSEGASQNYEALNGLKYLMSFIPAAIASISIIIVWIYPLNEKKMFFIGQELKKQRK